MSPGRALGFPRSAVRLAVISAHSFGSIGCFAALNWLFASLSFLSNSNDLDKKLSEAKSQFSAAKQPMEPKLCAEMTANLTALRGNPKALPGDMAKTVQAMSER